MPLVRKLIDLKTSKAITLPKSWLDNLESKTGKKIIAIALEVNGKISLSPVFKTNIVINKDSEAPALYNQLLKEA